MRRSSILAAALAWFSIGLHADSAPALQWVQALGGSGVSSVAGAAADAQGNLYIAGSTTSLDFPVTAAQQRAAGSSTLMRIDTATGATQSLFPAGLAAISTLAADPHNPRTVYGTAANTIWRSSDAGTTWTYLSQLQLNTAFASLAVDPSGGNNLYAGTTTLGVFKSADGGFTWTPIDNGIAPGQYGTNVPYIAVDPNTPQVVFALTPQGLARSPNGGATWKLAVSAEVLFKTLVFDPFAPGTVYLAAGATILKSTDDGLTFTPQVSLPNYNAPSAMAADPFHAGVLFAACLGAGIFQSSDSGATWNLKSNLNATLLAADPNRPVIYAAYAAYGVAGTSDGFATTSPIGLPTTAPAQLAVAGSNLFVLSAPTLDVFVVKLDPAGKVVYSTYFGGSGDDSAAAVAALPDGSVYVTGTTSSADFPTTLGAFLTTRPPANYPNPEPFLFKLNPDGTLAWSTYFAGYNSTPGALALDADGNPYIATTIPGQCIEIWPIGCLPGPPSVFVTKLTANGKGQAYSIQAYTASGSPYYTGPSHPPLGLAIDPNRNAYAGGLGRIALVNPAGTAVLASTALNGLAISALALDANANLYATGWWTNYDSGGGFPATPGAFQAGPQPAVPLVPGEVPGGGVDAFVVKWDGGLSQVLAATLLGGESVDEALGIAIDAGGNVIVSGFTDSKSFPTHAPFQAAFSARSGFVAALDGSLSRLLFSTFLGDGRPFQANAAVPDGNGNVLLAGSTLTPGPLFIGGDPGASNINGGLVVANKIALPPPPAARLDSVVNYASRVAAPLAPGETIAALGAGFGSDAQLLIDGVPQGFTSRTATSLVAVMPDGARTWGAHQLQVSSAGALSNLVFVPAAPASPGIYSVDGSGYGQGYILNADGTLNSPSNPAAPGSAITIFATGVGAYTLSGQYAVTGLMPSVFVDNVYCDGIAATMPPVAGLPGNVYRLGVFVPNPSGFKLPAQVRVRLVMGEVNSSNPDNSTQISQQGIILNVKQ